MREQGVVTKILSNHLVEVAFQRSEACEKCKLCHNLPENMVGVEAVNPIGAKKDDIVEIEIPSAEVVKGSIVVFLIPIFFLIFGYLFGIKLFAGQEVFGVICSLVFLFLSFYVLKWYDQNIQQKEVLRAKVLKVLPS
ncbi:SoxR reducing system RseC family protein [Candidatus Margulisiibacteriota bacterium]